MYSIYIYSRYYRSPQDFDEYFEQMLMISEGRPFRYPFVAESQNGGPKEFQPETIKTTKAKPPILYCENPRHPLHFNRQVVLNAVSPNRREKMEDICEATQIR